MTSLAAGRPARAVTPDRGGGRRLSRLQPAHRQAGALRRQCRRRRDRRRATRTSRRLRAALAARRRDRGDRSFLRQGRGRAGGAAAGGPGGVPRVAGARPSPGLDRLAHAAYHLLGLQSYFTAGEKEVRAWTIHQGDTAPAAARRSFTRTSRRASSGPRRWPTRNSCGSAGGSRRREQGLARAEGKEYVVQDGDVMLFRFSS